MAESDDMREEMRNAITVALTIASVAQRSIVRGRENARNDAQVRLAGTQAEAEATAALQRARDTFKPSDQAGTQISDDQAQFAELNDPGWWDTAGAQDIAAKWTDVLQAADSQDPEVASAARQAGRTMSDKLNERYDIDPGQIDATVKQQLDAYQDHRARPDASFTVGTDRLLAIPAAPSDEASTSGEQRRSELESDGVPSDAVDGTLAVEDAFPHRTDRIHYSEPRRPSAEQSESRTPQHSMARRRG